jgi:hypothetical protein
MVQHSKIDGRMVAQGQTATLPPNALGQLSPAADCAIVEASSRERAEAAAVQALMLSEEQHGRLLVQERE